MLMMGFRSGFGNNLQKKAPAVGLAADSSGADGSGADGSGAEGSGSDPGRHSSLQVLMREMAENTGVQGIPNIRRATSIVRRFFWTLLVVFAFALMVWKVTEAFMKYYSYPVETKVEYQYMAQLVFPAVTVCNFNPIRYSALDEAGPDLQGLLMHLRHDPHATENLTQPKEYSWNDATGSGSDESGSGSGSGDYDESDWMYFTEDDSTHTMVHDFMDFASLVPPHQRALLGHNMSYMLLDCTFLGKKCSSKNFTSFWNTMHGNCFTFNAEDGSNNGGIKVKKVGPLWGLKLEIFLDQDEYIPGLSDAAGLRVAIHNQSDMPFPDDEGFSVRPGAQTSVGIRRLEIRRAEPPHGECKEFTDEENLQKNGFVGELPRITYTATACKKSCYQKHLLEQCDCFDSNYPYRPESQAYADFSGKRPCSSPENKNITADCVDDISARFANDSLGCSQYCPISCLSVSYPHTVSQAMWPSEAASYNALLKATKQSPQLFEEILDMSPGERDTFIRDNMVRLEVYFEDLNLEKITTSSSYSDMDLFSDLGGQSGFWLGMSIIVFFELLELLADVILIACYKCKERKRDRQSVGHTRPQPRPDPRPDPRRWPPAPPRDRTDIEPHSRRDSAENDTRNRNMRALALSPRHMEDPGFWRHHQTRSPDLSRDFLSAGSPRKSDFSAMAYDFNAPLPRKPGKY